jgi:hypothetical protein
VLTPNRFLVERVSAFICFLCIQINFARALLLGLGLQTIFSMLKGAIKLHCYLITYFVTGVKYYSFMMLTSRCADFCSNFMLPFGNITVCFDDVCIRTFATI